jgi:hypothetical protein
MDADRACLGAQGASVSSRSDIVVGILRYEPLRVKARAVRTAGRVIVGWRRSERECERPSASSADHTCEQTVRPATCEQTVRPAKPEHASLIVFRARTRKVLPPPSPPIEATAAEQNNDNYNDEKRGHVHGFSVLSQAYTKASWIRLARHLTLPAAFLLRPRPAGREVLAIEAWKSGRGSSICFRERP